jgi:hypothetical protein
LCETRLLHVERGGTVKVINMSSREVTCRGHVGQYTMQSYPSQLALNPDTLILAILFVPSQRYSFVGGVQELTVSLLSQPNSSLLRVCECLNTRTSLQIQGRKTTLGSQSRLPKSKATCDLHSLLPRQ